MTAPAWLLSSSALLRARGKKADDEILEKPLETPGQL